MIRQTVYSESSMLNGYRKFLEDEALPTFEETLSNPHLDDRRRDLTSFSRYKLQLELTIIKYTLGFDLTVVNHEFSKTIEFLGVSLEVQQNEMETDIDQYILVVWTLSLASLFNTDISGIRQKLPYLGRDLIIDRLYFSLINQKIPSLDRLFPKLYDPIYTAIGEYKESKRTELIQRFLNGYFDGLKEYEAAWLNGHKEKDPEYYSHFGYWVFELAALVEILDWDDSTFRDHPLYPKDLVDWSRKNKSL